MLHTGKKTVILSNSVVSFISQFSIMVVNIENIYGVKKIFGTDLQQNKKNFFFANIRGCFVCSVLDVDEV